MSSDSSYRLHHALAIAHNYGAAEGEHQKMWCIDQMVRALTGCKRELRTSEHGSACYVLTPSSEYLDFLDKVEDEGQGPPWDEGEPPRV